MSELARRRCAPCEGGVPALDREAAEALLAGVPGWALRADGAGIERGFEFRDFHETMGFVNALAFIANREDHHPDLEVGYRRCVVRYTTHAIGGLSENDYICAAKINRLLD